ncbi:MAG: HlyU family transcriptional regulator [Pseudomonadota bacterium]
MSLFSKLFGGGGVAPEAETVEYEGFRITAAPAPEGNRFRIGARIEKEIDGEAKTHHLIRADVLDSRDQADQVSIAKAKQMIDEQGDGIFR